MGKSEKLIYNIIKVLYILFGLSGIFFVVWVWIIGDKPFEEDPSVGNRVLNPWITITIAGLVFTTLLALIGPVLNFIQHPKNAIKVLIGLGVLVVFGFICYSIAGNSFSIVKLEELETTKEISRQVGAALYFTYIVGGLAVVAILFSGIAGFFK